MRPNHLQGLCRWVAVAHRHGVLGLVMHCVVRCQLGIGVAPHSTAARCERGVKECEQPGVCLCQDCCTSRAWAE